MNDILELIRHYLPQGRMMQLATVRDGQPWICTVYFIEDKYLNLYWLSLPTRRHSIDIARHNKVAATIPIKLSRPVVGIQTEGFAEAVADRDTIAWVMDQYVTRYNSGHSFYPNFLAGVNQHVLFRLRPSSFVLFDEITYPEDGRQEVFL